MIWLNIRKLEDRIVNKKLSDSEVFNYLLTSIIYTLLYSLYATYIGHNPFNIISTCIVILITILGMNMVYKTASQKGFNEFFKRYVAITWVINNWLNILNISFIITSTYYINDLIRNYVCLLYSVFSYLAFYILVNRSFERIEKRESDSE
jgi:hypothetical protein